MNYGEVFVGKKCSKEKAQFFFFFCSALLYLFVSFSLSLSLRLMCVYVCLIICYFLYIFIFDDTNVYICVDSFFPSTHWSVTYMIKSDSNGFHSSHRFWQESKEREGKRDNKWSLKQTHFREHCTIFFFQEICRSQHWIDHWGKYLSMGSMNHPLKLYIW